MLHHEEARERWSRNAKRRATHRYLVFTQVRRWLEVTVDTLDRRRNGRASAYT
jgi:hypothetical protein